MKVVFLDRDGVINQYPGHTKYVTDIKGFKLLPKTISALKKLTQNQYHIFVVSNQAGVGKGLFSQQSLNAITAKMLKEITQEGCKIEKVFYCTCKSENGCHCRKPRIGNILKACEILNCSFEEMKNAWFIGDTEIDIKTGKNIGCKTGFVLSGGQKKGDMKKWDVRPDFIAKDLYDATELILKKDSHSSR